MVKDKKEKFMSELTALCKKHKITSWGFCGSGNTEEDFFGRISGYNAIINIAWLWQSAREQTKTFLDSFEGGWR